MEICTHHKCLEIINFVILNKMIICVLYCNGVYEYDPIHIAGRRNISYGLRMTNGLSR